MRPLYRALRAASVDWRNGDGHAGLWFGKYCDTWPHTGDAPALERWSLDASGSSDAPSPKATWLEQFTRVPVGSEAALNEVARRREALMAAHDQVSLSFVTDGPFVTGLGLEHPVENGFSWHHSLGTPFLPGSSVKGLVRAYASSWLNVDKARTEQIFGPRLAEPGSAVPPRAGSVVFLDALPARPVQLKVDIITPHYGAYYRDESGEVAPSDWHSPNPIPFLVVEDGTTFTFGLMPRAGAAQADCEDAKTWLVEALETLGAGAKTATGYGRFRLSADQKRALEQEQALRAREADLAGLSPILREMYGDAYEDPVRFMNQFAKWQARMEASEGEVQREIAEHLARWYQSHRTEQWNNPKGKNVDKVSALKAILGEA